MPSLVPKSQDGNIIKNGNTQFIKATEGNTDKMNVTVTKGGDLRAR